MQQIQFPGLGLTFHISQVAFTTFGKEVYWYGIIIALGMLLAIAFCTWESERVGLPRGLVSDVALVAVPAAIVCARLYFVLFDWDYYKDDLSSVFKIWEGGLAVYGGIIGGVLAAFVYCKAKRINWRRLFDVGAFGLLIGQAVGRWGNFTNGEAYGSPTTLPWRMDIIGETFGGVHPTFLYESLWNTLGFLALYCYRKRKKFDGELFALYVAWYGIGRAWIEQLRVDSLPYSGGFKISQIVAVVTAIVAIVTILYIRKKKKREEQA